jgi:hypothetical protein
MGGGLSVKKAYSCPLSRGHNDVGNLLLIGAVSAAAAATGSVANPEHYQAAKVAKVAR